MTWLTHLTSFADALVNRNSAEDVKNASANLHKSLNEFILSEVAAAIQGAASGGLPGAEAAVASVAMAKAGQEVGRILTFAEKAAAVQGAAASAAGSGGTEVAPSSNPAVAAAAAANATQHP